jgi:protein phosphatase
MNGLEAFGITDVGRKRKHNEDAYALDVEEGLFIVADGMGGHAAGEVASRITVETIGEFIAATRQKEEATWPFKYNHTLHFNSNRLAVAIEKANERVMAAVAAQPWLKGMGTTVVAALLHDNRLTVAHVGDSRMYRLRKEAFEQLTMDHSLLQELVDRGFYSAEEAQRATNKNYVTRALGVEATVEVEVHEMPVEAGDWLVLCSDGLTDMVEDEDIHLTISTFGGNLDTVARQLVQLANDSGGRDNISVVLAQVVELFPARRGILDRILAWFG